MRISTHRLRLLLAVLFALVGVGSSVAHGAGTCAEIFSGNYRAVSVPSDNRLLQSLLDRVPDEFEMMLGLKPLGSGAEALAAKIEMIDRAVHTVDLTYFIFKRDTSGYAILDALKRAIERGVKIRIMVDGAGSYHPTMSHFQPLFEANKKYSKSRLEVRVVNPIFSVRHTLAKLVSFLVTGRWNFDLAAANNRSHDKILLVDAGYETSWAIMGGRNVGDDYYGLNGPERAILDYEVLLKGTKVDIGRDPLQVVQRHFDALFAHRLNMAITKSYWAYTPTSHRRQAKRMTLAREALGIHKDVEESRRRVLSNEYWSEGFERVHTVFANDLQNVAREHRESLDVRAMVTTGRGVGVTRTVIDVLSEATKSIELVSPYALFGRRDIVRLKAWLLKNPDATLTIYTNSLSSTDNLLVYGLFRYVTLPRLQRLRSHPAIGDRLKINLFRGPGLLHAKLLTVDDKLTLVTTSNLDPRSRIHNSEIGLWQDSRHAEASVNGVRDTVTANSVPLETLERPPTTREEAVRDYLLKHLSRWFEKIGFSSQF